MTLGVLGRNNIFYMAGLYLFYAPFAFKNARERGKNNFQATLYMLGGFIVFALFLGGLASILYGCGMRGGDTYCGSGCIDTSNSQPWGDVDGGDILVGILMLVSAWPLGKMLERWIP